MFCTTAQKKDQERADERCLDEIWSVYAHLDYPFEDEVQCIVHCVGQMHAAFGSGLFFVYAVTDSFDVIVGGGYSALSDHRLDSWLRCLSVHLKLPHTSCGAGRFGNFKSEKLWGGSVSRRAFCGLG